MIILLGEAGNDKKRIGLSSILSVWNRVKKEKPDCFIQAKILEDYRLFYRIDFWTVSKKWKTVLGSTIPKYITVYFRRLSSILPDRFLDSFKKIKTVRASANGRAEAKFPNPSPYISEDYRLFQLIGFLTVWTKVQSPKTPRNFLEDYHLF